MKCYKTPCGFVRSRAPDECLPIKYEKHGKVDIHICTLSWHRFMFVISLDPLSLIFWVKTFQLDDWCHVFVLSKYKITKLTFELFSQTSHKWLVQSAIEKLLLHSVSEIQLYEHTIPPIYYLNKGWYLSPFSFINCHWEYM